MKKKGFTLIELIVVMVILAILVLLGVPKYKEYTNQARITKLIVEAKELEQASQKYYMTNQDWPRLSDDAYTAEEVELFGDKVYSSTGKVVELEEGNYYDIDYVKLSNYISKPSKPENYILQNPVGNVYSLDGLTEEAKIRILDGIKNNSPFKVIGGSLSDSVGDMKITNDGGYILVGVTQSSDGDFVGFTNKGSTDAFIMKLDSNYDKEWIQTFGGESSDTFNSVVQLEDGSYVTVGYSLSKTGDLAEFTNKDSFDAIMVKYNSNGEKLWTKSFNSSGGINSDQFHKVIKTINGDYIGVGNYGAYYGLFRKFSSNDELIVQRNNSSIDGRSLEYKSIQGLDNGFIVVGSHNGQYASGNYSSSISQVYVSKLSLSGTVTWQKTVTSWDGIINYRKSASVNDVIETQDGNYIVVGLADSNPIFGSGNVSNYQAIIMKFSSVGSNLWIKSINSSSYDQFDKVYSTSDGGCIAIGRAGANDGDLLGIGKGLIDVVFVKYDSLGNREWIKTLGGSDSDSFKPLIQVSDSEYIGNISSNNFVNSIFDYDLKKYEGIELKGGSDIILTTINVNELSVTE